MLKKTTAPMLALILMLALAQPAAAAPQDFHWTGWIEGLITSFMDKLEESFSALPRFSGGATDLVNSPSSTGETESAGSQEESQPAFWPGYDPVGVNLHAERADQLDDDAPNIWPAIEPVG